VLAHEDRHEQALPDYDQVIKLEPQRLMTWHLRGVSHFHLGHINESIADFNHYLELSPSQEPYHWQRGIAFYCAGRYEDGQRQFQLYHAVRSNDVENAVWHFLCVARGSGLGKARESFLPVSGDRRVPMMQIYAFFAGKAQPEEVMAAAKAGNAKGDELKRRLFFADLYLGLYDDVTGNATGAREHMTKAVEEAPANDYMGDVARLQAQRLRPAVEGKDKP
jgi:lipoprotein NlpI